MTETSAEAVAKLCLAFAKLDIPIWIDGGWGVDALLQSQTRTHDDVDIVVESKNLDRFVEFLRDQGFFDVPRDDTKAWNFVLARNDGTKIDVHVVNFDEHGNGIYGPPENGSAYPHYAFGSIGRIGSLDIACISPKYQMESHTGYSLREKDYQDVHALCKRFDLPLPKEYLVSKPTL